MFKDQKSILWAIVIVAIFIIGFWLRIYPLSLPTIDRGIYKQYRHKLNKAELKKLTREAKMFNQDEQGMPYVFNMDPYLWMKKARDYLEDPDTYESPLSQHPKLVALAYKAYNSSFGAVKLEHFFIYFPLLFYVLLFLLVLILARNLKIQTFSLTMVLLMTATSVHLITKSGAGIPDTDIYNLVFPSLIVLIVFRSYASTFQYRGAFGLVLAALTQSIYILFWRQAWFVTGIVLFAMVTDLLLTMWWDRAALRERALRLACYVLSFRLPDNTNIGLNDNNDTNTFGWGINQINIAF